MGYGNTVVWSSSAEAKNIETSEIFYFCDEDSCVTFESTEDFSVKIFHRDVARQIAIEIETPQAENFYAIVYDLLGRKIISANISSLYGKNIYPISSESFQQGIYIVHLQSVSNPEQHLTQKLFIPN
jgi:hypothetical protein